MACFQNAKATVGSDQLNAVVGDHNQLITWLHPWWTRIVPDRLNLIFAHWGYQKRLGLIYFMNLKLREKAKGIFDFFVKNYKQYIVFIRAVVVDDKPLAMVDSRDLV